jgi:hypothetical protein
MNHSPTHHSLILVSHSYTIPSCIIHKHILHSYTTPLVSHTPYRSCIIHQHILHSYTTPLVSHTPYRSCIIHQHIIHSYSRSLIHHTGHASFTNTSFTHTVGHSYTVPSCIIHQHIIHSYSNHLVSHSYTIQSYISTSCMNKLQLSVNRRSLTHT